MTSDSRHERLVKAGRWLREQRQRRFPTAVEFARRLGVDRAVVSNYERGVNAVDDERALQIAEVLGMDIITVRRNLGLWVPDDVESGVEVPSTQVEDLLQEGRDLMAKLEDFFGEADKRRDAG